MWLYYLKIALRNIKANPYSFSLNFIGLVLGISCFSTLQFYIYHEHDYESFFSNSSDLYRVTTYFKRGENEVKWAITNGGLVEILNNDISQVEEATKILTIQSDASFQIGNEVFRIPERNGFYCDSNFFQVLDYNLIKGDVKSALSGANKIVLSNEFAKKLFPHENDVLGKTIEILNSEGNTLLEVTGVVTVPSNSHLQFNYLLSGTTIGVQNWSRLSDTKRGGFPVRVYFRKNRDSDFEQLNNDFTKVYNQVYEGRMSFPIQPINEIHFNADNLFEHAKVGNLNFVVILNIISWLILAIAIINFILLNTSAMLKRQKEIGVRKSLGTSWNSLLLQYLVEAGLLGIISGVFSVLVMKYIAQNVFSTLFHMDFTVLNNYLVVIGIIVFSFCVSVLSGIFPIIKTIKKNVVTVLRYGTVNAVSSNKKLRIRSFLIVVQFAFTLSIVSGAFIVVNQLEFLKNKNLGYDKDQLINIKWNRSVSRSQWDFFAQSLKNESSINNSGQILYDLISDYNATAIRLVDDQSTDTLSLRLQWNSVDYNTLPTIGVEFVEGRNFSPDVASDSSAIILNEAAVRELGMNRLVGKSAINYFSDNAKIIGVIKDFHFQSFDKEVIPVMFVLSYMKTNLLVNVSEANFRTALNAMENNWKEAGISTPFEYTFIDQDFKSLIENEQNLSLLIIIFATISIVIALLGVLGLISHSTRLRMKEIAIRKVLGASSLTILYLINKTVIYFIAIGLLIAIPLTIWAGSEWLGNFAYRIEITGFELLQGFVMTLVITVLVVTIQSLRAAHTNPSRILKSD